LVRDKRKHSRAKVMRIGSFWKQQERTAYASVVLQ
jgi:hypothetical protein